MTHETPAAASAGDSGAAAGRGAGEQLYRLIADRAGERLDQFVARVTPSLSRSQAQRLIDAGAVRVDGRLERSSAKLAHGALIEVTPREPVASSLVPEPMSLQVLYEDADLLVVNKPSGVTVHPSAGHETGTLVHGLLAHCTDLSGIGGELRPGIVHRLDRDTSGLLMVAKNDRAHASLSGQLQRRTVDKFYLALLHGEPRPERGIIDAPIDRHPTDRLRMAVRTGGRPSRTRYATSGRVDGYALVAAGLDTGRTHQIRVHFASLGCPVAGDAIYGVAGGPAGRLWLHAWQLAFDRPADGARLTFTAPPPTELTESWASLAAEHGAEALERALVRAERWTAAQRQKRGPVNVARAIGEITEETP